MARATPSLYNSPIGCQKAASTTVYVSLQLTTPKAQQCAKGGNSDSAEAGSQADRSAAGAQYVSKGHQEDDSGAAPEPLPPCTNIHDGHVYSWQWYGIKIWFQGYSRSQFSIILDLRRYISGTSRQLFVE